MDDETFDRMADEAMVRYAEVSRTAQGMLRGKLRGDPVYRELLHRGIAAAPRIVDLGCGRGLLFALIVAARGENPRPELHGVEIDKVAAGVATRALGDAATIVVSDLRTAPIPACDVVTLLDVAHYLPVAVQDDLILRIRVALPPGGRLFLREADAAAGAGFLAVRVTERLTALARGNGFRRFAYRSTAEWRARLEAAGFAVATAPMSAGTPFANVLIEARAGA
jgi:SAM-dependent methyltransferase